MSNLIINLNKVADSLETAGLLLDKIKTDSKAAINPQQYVAENKTKTVQQLRNSLDELNTERRKILISEISKHKNRLDDYTKKQKPDNQVLQFMRAERINNAKSAEEAISIYKRQLDRMSDDERNKARFIYDDALHEYIAREEPSAVYRVEQTIDEYRNDIEKNYIQELKIAHEINENSKIIDAQIEEQIKAMQEGETPALFDWARIVNEIKENAKYAVRGPEANKIDLNPYDAMLLSEMEIDGIEPAAETETA